MGAFVRDRVLLETIATMMDYNTRVKENSVYLMKLGSHVRVSACKWVIFIVYRFPVIDPRDYIPYKVLSIPKKINGKYFSLKEIPHTVVWAD